MLKTSLIFILLFLILYSILILFIKIITKYFPSHKTQIEENKAIITIFIAMVAALPAIYQIYAPVNSYIELQKVLQINPNRNINKDSLYVDLYSNIEKNDIVYYVNMVSENDTLLNLNEEILGYRSSKYRIEEIQNGKKILIDLSNRLNVYLRNNKNPNIKIEVELFGQSDCTPTKRGTKYKGDLGIIENIEYLNANNNEIEYKTLFPHKSRIYNADYAFLRLFSCEQILKQKIKLSNIEYKRIQNVSAKRGLKERLTIVKIRVINGIEKDFDDFNFLQKKIFKMQK